MSRRARLRRQERRAKRLESLSPKQVERREKIKDVLVDAAEKVADVVTTVIPGEKDDIAVDKLKDVVKKKVAKKRKKKDETEGA